MSARLDVDARARVRRLDLAILAVVSYVPFLLSSPGKVSGDTKAYLYLDPGRLLSRAAYLWDPHVGAGTVPHQNIGYLFPMGPYYWVMEHAGVPDWVAQRLWLGSVSFAAGAGVLWLFTMRGVRRSGALIGALVYLFTPYQLAFTARMSVILLPWAGLPWLVALTARAQARRGWRDPALFALVTLLIGGTNATALLLAGLGPVLWLVISVVERRATAREALATAGRIALPTVGVSMWWGAGLVDQGRYGIPILDVTETVRAVADSSLPTEVLRGLGNWFFYGGDRAGPWLDQSVDYTDRRWLVAVTFAIPIAALIAAAMTRWRYRGYFGALVVVGAVVAIGAYPYDDPSPLGALFEDLASGSAVGLALRNTPRAVPLVVLGIAGLLAAGVSALAPRIRVQQVAAAGVGVLVVVGFVPVWSTGYLSERILAPEEVPAYWMQVAGVLDAEPHDTRVLEIPGTPFAAYTWGNTVDPITPGLIDRPWLARELLPSGAPATVDLLAALDRRMQEGTFETSSLAPIARLLSVGTVVLRSDLDHERYGTPLPDALWLILTEPRAPGLASPEGFGPVVVTHGGDAPRSVEVFAVDGTPRIVGTASQDRPVVLAGDGDGIVDVAAAGLLTGDELLVYSASLDDAALRRAMRADGDLVVTDTNRRRARRWNALRDVTGYTEAAGEEALVEDVDDHRLELFDSAGDDARTVAEQRGARVRATAYGTTGMYAPDDRPVYAFDGDVTTAWRVGGNDDPSGERLVIELARPVTADRVTLVQPPAGPGERSLTKVRLRIDDTAPVMVTLDELSSTGAGQEVRFERRRFRRVEIEMVATSSQADGQGVNGVGFAEVRVGERRADELVRMPVDLLERAGRASLDHRLVLVMSRLRHEPGALDRDDEERALARRFVLPTAREFSLSGVARVVTDGGAATSSEVPAGVPRTEPGACRDDVLTLDGQPLPVSVSGAAAEPGGLAVEMCEGARQLAAGSHVLRARPGRDTGIDVDRLVWSSAPGGDAASPAVLGAPRSASNARARVVDSGPTSYDLEVRTDGSPFWLVLGQSHNDGWTATTASGRDLGPSQLVNGYANGWPIDPARAGTMTVHLRWKGQRIVWLGLGASVLAVVACGALVVFGRRRDPSPLDDAPVGVVPWRGGAAGSLSHAGAVALAAGLAAWAVSRPWIGGAVVAGVFATLRYPRARLVLTLGGAVALVAAKALSAPELAWVTVTFLGADLVCGWAVERGAISRRADPG